MSISDDELERDPVLEAKKYGLKCVKETNRLLLIDIDSGSAQDCINLIRIFERSMVRTNPIDDFYVTFSKGGNRHVYVWLRRRMNWMHRAILRAAFGSDHKRELFDYLRRMKQIPHPTVLFETEEEYKKVMSWLKEKRK